MNNFKKQKGVILLLTMFILTGILVITLGAADLVLAGIRMNRLTGYSTLAFYAAEAGLERSLWEARKNGYAYPDINTPNVFTYSMANNSAYKVDYATSTPAVGFVTFTSVGDFKGAKRSVESAYEPE